jgi:hypothetical protein
MAVGTDMIAMLKSASAPGRQYVLYATDEIAPDIVNFNNSPTNVLGFRTEETKLGVYAKWAPFTTRIVPATVQKEFYDYTTPNGQLEVANTAAEDPRADSMYETLIKEIIPNELAALLPPH